MKLHSSATALLSGDDFLPVIIKMTGYARKKERTNCGQVNHFTPETKNTEWSY